MRIACLHLPQFALQCVTRIDPALRGAAVAVVGSGHDPVSGLSSGSSGSTASFRVALHSPVVQACSRAAYALGVRVGMTATAARAASPEIKVIAADATLERETVRALADALLSATPVVDVGGRVGSGGAHLAMYCEVPTKTRGTSFGDRLLQKLDALGMTARVGIADDRFTAWVAAWGAGDGRLGTDDNAAIVSVPRGGSAAFLAPLPLSLLSISPEVQHMLEALGIRTLGEFAALPAPSVARPLEADYQALARGDSGSNLRPYVPEAPIREELAIGAVDDVSSAAPSAPAAVALLAERVALRLAGRARGAARLEVTVSGADGERVVPITPLSSARPLLASAEELAEAIGTVLQDGSAPQLARRTPEAGPVGEGGGGNAGELRTPTRLKVAVTGEAIAGDDTATVNTLADDTDRVDALSLVLSTTGAVELAFGSSALGSSAQHDRNDRKSYRRTRRGKQRRRGEAAAELIQPRLFKL
jgi:protein ImuB